MRTRRAAGLTLLEVLVASALLAVFFVSVYSLVEAMIATRNAIEEQATPFAVGPTVMERIGGTARIARELIDDCALARAVKNSGGRVWLGLSDRAASSRQYRTFAEIGGMISRTAYTQ